MSVCLERLQTEQVCVAAYQGCGTQTTLRKALPANIRKTSHMLKALGL